MADTILFVSMSLALLLTPGPTNTLLLVGGATAGFRRALGLPPAELLGYLAAIHILAFSLGPLIAQTPGAQIAMRLALSAYLIFLAGALWIRPAAGVGDNAVTPLRVFIVTLLNPKALVFAFVVLPPLAGHWPEALPHLMGLCGLIVFASLVWIGLGAGLRAGRLGQVNIQIVRRLGAVVLLVFALTISLPRVF